MSARSGDAPEDVGSPESVLALSDGSAGQGRPVTLRVLGQREGGLGHPHRHGQPLHVPAELTHSCMGHDVHDGLGIFIYQYYIF